MGSTSRSIDATTRTLLTQLEVDNSKGELLSGSFVQVHLPLPLGLASWRLPSNTLLFRADGLHVATVDANNRVQLNTVTIGRDFGNEIEIVAGLKSDDQVIINPPDSIISGQEVQIVQATLPGDTK